MKSPYIGITDFMSAGQSGEMANFFNRIIQDKTQPIRHKLMVGAVSYYETLNNLPSEWTEAVPRNKDIAEIFIDHPRLFNTIHYVDFENRNLLENLMKVTELGGKNMHAIELDMVWPEQRVLKEYRSRFPNIKTILQINTPALNALSDLEDSLIRRIASYDDALDFCFFDKSMGKGLGMDSAFLQPLIQRTIDKLPNIGIAVAGGLGPNKMHLVEPLVKDFSELSIDAESQLRPSGDAHDPIDWQMARDYLEQSLNLFYP